MARSWNYLAGAALLLALTASPHAAQPRALQPVPSVLAKPLAFELNRGQANPRTEFVARAPGYVVHLMSSDARLSLGSASDDVRLLFTGAADSKPQPLDRQNVRAHYYDVPSARDVPVFGRIKYPATYPGIDVIYFGKHGELEFDLDVAPGGDLSQVRLHVEGADGIRIDIEGALCISVAGIEVRIDAPTVYHDRNRSRAGVATVFRLEPNNTVSIASAPTGPRAKC